jgi:hypothetical protein
VSTNRTSRNQAGTGGRGSPRRGTGGGPASPRRGSAGRPASGRGPGSGRGPRRPLPTVDTLYTPEASGLRRALERRSAAPLAFLHQLPALVPALVLGVLLVAGLAVKGPIGAAALCCVAAVLGWFAFLSWPRLASLGRLGRAAAIGCVLAVAVLQVTR